MFESDAISQQEALSEPPLLGSANSTQKQNILSNWALNDVGSCYFILGQSLETLGQLEKEQIFKTILEKAKNIYVKAQRFPYARAWDPQGWFWSPAEGAKNRLDELD